MSAPIIRPPSAWQMEQAMTALLSARSRMLEDDAEIAGDEALLADILGSNPETCDCMDMIHRVLRAAVHAKSMEYSRAIGALEYARDALLEAAVAPVTVEPSREPEAV